MNLRAAVIGLGHLGRHHARILDEIPGIDLVAICDTDPAKFEQAECPRGPLRTPDAGEAMASADLVVVAVPTLLHAEVALPALRTGRDVLVEKPLASDMDSGLAMVEGARESAVSLLCGHVERFNGAFRSLALPLAGPRFVEGHRLAPFTARSLDVDVVLDLMVHDLDLLLHLVGRPVVGVEAVGIPVISSRVDIANARITFEGGCVANLTSSRVSESATRKLRVFDRDAYYSLDFKEGSAGVTRLVGLPGGPARPVREVLKEAGEPLRLELEDFVACARARREGRPAASRGASGEEALAALGLALEVRSAIGRHFARFGGAGT